MKVFAGFSLQGTARAPDADGQNGISNDSYGYSDSIVARAYRWNS